MREARDVRADPEQPRADRDHVEHAREVVRRRVVRPLLVVVVEAVQLRDDHPAGKRGEEDDDLGAHVENAEAVVAVDDPLGEQPSPRRARSDRPPAASAARASRGPSPPSSGGVSRGSPASARRRPLSSRRESRVPGARRRAPLRSSHRPSSREEGAGDDVADRFRCRAFAVADLLPLAGAVERAACGRAPRRARAACSCSRANAVASAAPSSLSTITASGRSQREQPGESPPRLDERAHLGELKRRTPRPLPAAAPSTRRRPAGAPSSFGRSWAEVMRSAWRQQGPPLDRTQFGRTSRPPGATGARASAGCSARAA